MLRKRVIVHTLLFAQCVNSNKKTTNVEFCRTLRID